MQSGFQGFLRKITEKLVRQGFQGFSGLLHNNSIGAAMHKLIRIVYGVLTSGQKYDPTKLKPPQTGATSP
jgi:hypothetical protein